MLKIYNSLTKKKESFINKKDKVIKIFICGPTLYDSIHLGHFRILLISDLIIRYLNFKNFKVIPIINLTDMDFKVIETAKNKNISSFNLTDKYYNNLINIFKKIKIEGKFKIVRTSSYVKKSIKIIDDLLSRNLAYKLNEDIFCDTSYFKKLGNLSSIKKEELIERIYEPFEGKRNLNDFRLWISFKDKNHSFKTKYGNGFIGWNLQDFTVINEEFKGEYHLHIGAKDLIYPHHEFILLLGEYYKSKYPIANSFLHIGLVKVKGEKMSKSLKNYIYVEDILKKYDLDSLKIYFLLKNYKKDFNFKYKDLEKAIEIKEKLKRVKLLKSNKYEKETNKKINSYINRFIKYIENDFLTSKSLKLWIDFVNFVENNPLDKKGINLVNKAYKIFTYLTGILEENFTIL